MTTVYLFLHWELKSFYDVRTSFFRTFAQLADNMAMRLVVYQPYAQNMRRFVETAVFSDIVSAKVAVEA